MKIEKIKKIIKLLEESSLTTLEITENTDTLRLSKGTGVNEIQHCEGKEIPTIINNVSDDVASKTSEEKEPEGFPITSPMVGVFYQAPSPNAEPFVQVGDRVEKGQVVCIVEAMKLMNEIQANKSGEIVEICVKDGEPVEYGQHLFYVK